MANPYDTGLDKTPANYQPLTPLVFLQRAAAVHPGHTAIVHGKTRGECLMRLKRALDEFVIDGIETTLPLFRALVREKDIIDGDYHIRWLEEFLARGGMDE